MTTGGTQSRMLPTFKFQNLQGFHPDVRSAIAADKESLASFVLAEIDYLASELDEPLRLNQFDDPEVQDYLSWLQQTGTPGTFPAQILLGDAPEKRKTWAKRRIDPEVIAEQIAAMPDAALAALHPMLEVWSAAKSGGRPIDQVITVCAGCGEPVTSAPADCPHCGRHVLYPAAGERVYPFHLRLSAEDIVVVSVLLAVLDTAAFVDATGSWSYPAGKPPAAIQSLTRLLFDRDSGLEVAYLPDRIEVFHKEPRSEQERVARNLVSWAIPTATNPSPLKDKLPEGAPTAFDLPAGEALDAGTGVMSILTKLSTGDLSDLTMEDAKAFEAAVHKLVGVPEE